MAGGDHVEVNLHRADAAASALEGLRDALAQHVPAILTAISNLRSEGADLPPPRDLNKLLGRAAQDAAEMRTTARLATQMNNQMLSQHPPVVVTGMLDLGTSWDPKALDAADAKAEAQALQLAEDNKDPKAARAAILAIQQDVQDHVQANDTAWLTAFYNRAAPQVANLASVLHNEDVAGVKNYNNRFDVLTQSDQQIMSTFGNGLAAADKAGLSPQAVRQISNAPNLWSAAMLVKFGPDGSKWATAEQNPGNPSKLDQPSLLAQLTNSVYEAQSTGKLQLPLGGYAYDPNVTASDYKKLQDAAANFDPLTTMLQRDAENKAAAGQVLGGKDGNGIAQQLLKEGIVPGGGNATIFTYSNNAPNRDGRFPANFTGIPPNGKIPYDGITIRNTLPASVVASFLDAATSAGRGAGDPNDPINPYKLSAQAAANIIMNTPPGWTDNNGKPQYSYDPAVEKSLTNTFLRYLPDIANSSRQAGGESVTQADNSPGGGWEIHIPQAQLSNYLQQISSDPKNYGYIKGAVASKAGIALGLQLKGVSDGTDPYADLSSLYGRLINENNNLKYKGQQQVDANNAELNAEISFGESFIGDIPVVGKPASTALSWDQKMKDLGFPQIPQFSTDNAAQQAAAGQKVYSQAELTAMIPIVQGLAKEDVNVYDKKDGWVSVQQEGTQQGWYKNGQVVPNDAFWQWWRDHDGAFVRDQSAPDRTDSQLDDWYQKWVEWMRLQHDISDQTGGH